GHIVTLYEATSEIGGQLRLAARIPGKEDYAQALQSWRMRLAAAGVGIRLETRPTGRDLAGFHDLIIATGVGPRDVDLPRGGGPRGARSAAGGAPALRAAPWPASATPPAPPASPRARSTSPSTAARR